MKTYRIILLIATGVLTVACATKENPIPEPELKPVNVNSQGLTLKTETLFYQSQSVTNALTLVPRESDDVLVIGFNTEYSSVNYRYSYPEVNITPKNQAVTATVEDEGVYETHFHLEVPMTAEAHLPEAFLEVESLWVDGWSTLSISLAPDFPFTKAQIKNASVTFPAWIDSEEYSSISNHREKWSDCTLLPGQVTYFHPMSEEAYTLQEGEGIREENHLLTLDGTVIIDGTICVEEADRKDSARTASPWSTTFYVGWEHKGHITLLTGKMNLDKSFNNRTRTFSEIPDIFKCKELVFDLEDLHGEVRVQNDLGAPVSVSGILMGDEREYPFGSENGLTPIWVPVGKDDYHIFFSEKGGRVKEADEFGDPYTDRVDVPTPGFSGLIDEDPVSFSLKGIRAKSDPQQSIRFVFNEDHWVSVQGRIHSLFRVGKDFQFQTSPIVLLRIPNVKTEVAKIEGSFQISNSYPFDFEITPIFSDRKGNLMPIRLETIRIPAGERGNPTVVPVDFNWESSDPVSLGYLGLNIFAHTGEGREGTALYQDQEFAIEQTLFEVF